MYQNCRNMSRIGTREQTENQEEGNDMRSNQNLL